MLDVLFADARVKTSTQVEGRRFPAVQMKAGRLGIQYLNKHNSANNTPKIGMGVTDAAILVLQYLTISTTKNIL